MRLFFRTVNGTKYIYDGIFDREITTELLNVFYRNGRLTEASNFCEITLISCLLQTLVADGKLEQDFKGHLVSCLNETKRELFEVEEKLAKAWEEIQRLKERNRELVEKQGAKK